MKFQIKICTVHTHVLPPLGGTNLLSLSDKITPTMACIIIICCLNLQETPLMQTEDRQAVYLPYKVTPV